MMDRRLLLIGGAALALAPRFAASAKATPSADLFARELPRSRRSGRVRAADGEQIAWSAYGEGPLALILVHGWMCDRSYWHRQIATLGERYRVILLDLPGHGDSTRTRAHWTIQAFADDMARVAARAAGGRPLYLIGHSLGGSVVAFAAARTPHVIGLCAVDSFTAAHPVLPPPLPAATGADYVQQMSAALRRGMFEPESDSRTADRIAEAMARGPESIAKALAAELRLVVGAPALSTIPARLTLMLINSERRPVDLASVRSVHANSAATVVLGSGHFIMLDKPARCSALLTEAIEAARKPLNGSPSRRGMAPHG